MKKYYYILIIAMINSCSTSKDWTRDTETITEGLHDIEVIDDNNAIAYGYGTVGDTNKEPGNFRVERFVTSPLPHRPGRADFPHPVPQVMDSLHKQNDRFWVWLTQK